MFEVTGTDIANLSDSDLRTLVARLATAELTAQGAPISAVTAGGHQDAADGGIDVRVDCSAPLSNPDFVRRAKTGFQVKKPDMPSSEINNEMRPGGALRPVIAELAAASGAYIIVSAKGSIADRPLAERRDAMRTALEDLPTQSQLYTDFYDRDRVAAWVNQYPGVAAWVRARAGQHTEGWSCINQWRDAGVSKDTPYLSNDKACLIDERSSGRKALTILRGIAQLRTCLRNPRQCVRLIGLSGLGKTRLVHALFEPGVGDEPLDVGIAVYTDYSSAPNPTAPAMAEQLVASGRRAILIIDNCNPGTHERLVQVCSASESRVSLLTVEYDVREDEPEDTDVFRLQAAAPVLVARWLETQFPTISQIDRQRIAEFSDGNYRIARALAKTLKKGESLGWLRNDQLFERIFQQRKQYDKSLLTQAQYLALLYSIDGQNTDQNSELAIVAGLGDGVTARALFEALAELLKREVAQQRGYWRAILPPVLANWLAGDALTRIPAGDFDRFATMLTPRMRKSVSRRLGYLHDVAPARDTVARWLSADGPLGDLFRTADDGCEIVANLAPANPGAVLKYLTTLIDTSWGSQLLEPNNENRWRWIALVKSLAYDAQMFDDAVILLARFVAAEAPDDNHCSATGPFGELFQMELSGTQASPSQRQDVIRRLAHSGDANCKRAALVALQSLLISDHFNASSSFEFGARSRDWGWQPQSRNDIQEWSKLAIDLAVMLSPILAEARTTLAKNVRSLWSNVGCHQALEQAAMRLHLQKPWVEGWLEFRATLRFDGGEMDGNVRSQLEAIINLLAPADLLEEARAVVLSGYAWADGQTSYENAGETARTIGEELTRDENTQRKFLNELVGSGRHPLASQCGIGLAQGAADLNALWQALVASYASARPESRDLLAMGGFIQAANKRDPTVARAFLEAAIDDPLLVTSLVYLQVQVATDEEGIARLCKALRNGKLASGAFNIHLGDFSDVAPDAFSELLWALAERPDGLESALGLLRGYFARDRQHNRQTNPDLVEIGRTLLSRLVFSKDSAAAHQISGLDTLIRTCCSGTQGEDAARQVCENILVTLQTSTGRWVNMAHILKALFQTQPLVALDTFVLADGRARIPEHFNTPSEVRTPVDELNPSVLQQWAGLDAAQRYPLLGRWITMLPSGQHAQDQALAPLFLEMLSQAPDKHAFLGKPGDRLCPRYWVGSLVGVLELRKGLLTPLSVYAEPAVRAWAIDAISAVNRWISTEQHQEQSAEHSFE